MRSAKACNLSAFTVPFSSQTIIQTTKQMHNRFFRFVAHVGEAEGLAFDLAVAGVDDEMVLFAEIAREFRNVDAAGVSNAGQRLGPVALGGKEIEAGAADPVVDESVRSGMAL